MRWKSSAPKRNDDAQPLKGHLISIDVRYR